MYCKFEAAARALGCTRVPWPSSSEEEASLKGHIEKLGSCKHILLMAISHAYQWQKYLQSIWKAGRWRGVPEARMKGRSQAGRGGT